MKNRLVRLYCIMFLFGMGMLLPANLQAWDYSQVPGTVIDFINLDYTEDGVWPFQTSHDAPRAFIADPEIFVVSTGVYLASCAPSGWDTSSGTSGQTTIWRSTDHGASWTEITTLNNILRGSFFEQGGVVYLVGCNDDELYSDTMMSKSTNYGLSWTTPANFGAVDGDGTGPGTPCNPVVFDGHWWACDGAINLMTAAVSSDLYSVSSWTRLNGVPGPNQLAWFTSSCTEPQVVASPNLGVFMLNQLNEEKNTALSRVANIGGTYLLRFDNSMNGFPSLPCGEKKFGAAYDSVSGKFYILGNPNLPSDESTFSSIDPQMIRNTAAVLSSKDLLHWNVEKIFIYSSDVSHEGYGYLNFDFDGNDMVVAARTASADIPGATDPDDGRGGHDSNCFTYHRITDFRNLVADHVVWASGSGVIRYERTPETNDQNVIFGNFALGSYASTIAGATGLGFAGGGTDIYAQSGGTIYHFDAFGNFLETVASAPVAVTNPAVLSRPPAGESCWTKSSSGDWSDQTNWHYWGRADTDDETALFGTAITGNSTINLASAQQTWGFNTNGDFEGWSYDPGRVSATVSGGYLSGTVLSSSVPYFNRTDCLFYGADAPTVSVRMKGSENCTVYLLWTDSLDPNATHYVSASYTGGGAWQTVSFSMDGVSGWEDKMIASLRIDPRVSQGETFDIDWISVSKAAARIKGVRFNNGASSYTIDGAGMLAIDADSGNGSLEVVHGSHTIDNLIFLKKNTDVTTANGTTLNLSGGVSFWGRTLSVSGTGYLKLGGFVYLRGGKLVTDGQRPIYINSGISGALDGTLEYSPSAGLSPYAGQSYSLLSNVTALNGMTFTSVVLPTLPTGLSWNTNSLYTTGIVSIDGEDRSLTVSSAHGSPSPSVGTHNYTYGTNLTATVGSPVYDGNTRYVCDSWTGTGSVPSSGSGNNTGSFSLTLNSTLTWNWSTDYWLATDATAGGYVTVSSSWRDAGSVVSITAVPSANYHFTGWTGDTSGAVINGTQITLTMSSSRSVTASFAIDQHTLTVSSTYGSPTPSVGSHSYDYGTSVAAWVNSPVTNGTTRYACSGWTGTGNVPATGSTAATGNFTLTQDSSVAWQWAVSDYWLNTEATAGGSVNVSDGWKTAGSSVQITATPSSGYVFTGWTGDTSGDTGSAVMTLPMDQARSVTATFAEVSANTLPYIETFEGYAAGDSILVDGNTNGWFSSTNATVAVVTNRTYTWDSLYYPVESAAHTKVLDFSDADLSVQVETNAEPANITVDFMLSGLNPGEAPDASVVGDHQTAFFVDFYGHLNVWLSLDDAGISNAWYTFSGTSISTSDWVRLTYEFDYTTETRNFFKIALNGVDLVPEANGFSRGESSFTSDPAGAWMLNANQDAAAIQTFTVKGSGLLDDLVITTNAVTDFIRPVPAALPFTQTFESTAVGDSLFVEGKTNGWYNLADAGSAVVTNLTYTWNSLTYPVDAAAHTKLLSCSAADFGIQLVPAASADTTVDFMLSGIQQGSAPASSLVENKQSAFFVDPYGYLNVWCGLDTSGSNNTWVTYSDTSISGSDWVRITCEFDYTTETRNFFRILLNGVELLPGNNAYSKGVSAFSADANGAWLLTANQDVEGIETVRFKGNGLIDDLVVTTATVSDFFKLYTITASAGANGSVSPLSTNVPAGGSATFTVTADNYYRIASLTTNGASAGSGFDNDSTATNFTWSNVQASGALAATFTEQVTDNNPAAAPYPWLAQYGLTNFTADAVADADGDGLLSWQEYIAGTDPTNPASAFRISDTAVGSQGTVIRWNSVAGRLYSLDRSTNLLEGFTTVPGASNIVATPPENTYTNTGSDSEAFYKISVRRAD